MKTKKYVLYISIACIAVLSGFQINENPEFLDKLRLKLQEYNSKYPQEKIYLQFDKPFYKPGEDIWFNAFVLNSNTHKPSELSEVLYVDLSDPKGNVVSHLELVINDGTVKGDFRINPDDMGGLYHVQAYTTWMKNFGAAPTFKKEIQVQKVITPRLLLKLEFEKEAYGKGDSVIAKLNVRNLKNEKVNSASVNYTVFLDGIKKIAASGTTDSQGNQNINFMLPHVLTSADGLLQVVVSSNGTEESVSRSIPIVLNKISLSFFPEGGNLIENTDSRIAFKALNEYQKGADVAGFIVDENNNQITSFSSFHMGMGAFELRTLKGKQYFAKILTPAGNEKLIRLPVAQPYGYGMKLNGHNDSSVELAIESPLTGSVYLAGQAHGNLYYSEKINLQKGLNNISIDTQKFPAGIGVFTLFRESGQGLCERLVFLNSAKKLNIHLKTEKDRYLPGEKVRLKIETTDENGKPLPAKLSLSIADDQLISFANDKQDNIISSIFLSSEVKGEIQKPSFYFDSNEPKAKQALDYLLMTQGWRRFNWNEIEHPTVKLTFDQEKVKTISGVVFNKEGAPCSDEVMLIELGNKKRLIKVYSTPQGNFSFMNTDPTVPVMLLSAKQNKLQVVYPYTRPGQNSPSNPRKPRPDEQAVIVKKEKDAIGPVEVVENQEEALAEATTGEMDLVLNEDVQSLDEVVVVGYAAERKSDLTGSVAVIHSNSLGDITPLSAIENHLQGRAAGVIVEPAGKPGSPASIRIRGISSLGSGNSEPLYVIDGNPVGTSINYNFSNSSMLSADDIQTIEVLHSPEATALFGSSAANGAILITTRSGVYYSYREQQKINNKFSSTIVSPRKFSPTREFYSPAPTKGIKEKREDMRTTIYWNPEIITDQLGTATIIFNNNDAVSAFRMTAEGITSSGLIGRSEEVYSTLLPISVDAKLPAYLGYEDVISVPIRITNETEVPVKTQITLSIPKGLQLMEGAHRQVEVKAKETRTVTYTLKPLGIQGEFPLTIKVESEGYSDVIEQMIVVKPVGFPMRASFSGKELQRNVKFHIEDAETGTITAELTAFPNVLSDLFTGVESIFKEPYGCFEQASSSTFPNVLALQYLQRSGLSDPVTEKRALSYIQNGYKKLTSYEVKGGGFEWFGSPPAHEALTAYGLIEFFEMQKAYPEVSTKMIERTREWLLSRRKGDGTFLLQSHGFDNFARPSGDISNAYITYALSETGTKDLEKEYQFNLEGATRSKDMYQLALMANIAHNLGKKSDYDRLVYLFEKKIVPSGLDDLTASHSIVWSQGISLTNETIALWAIALMKDRTEKMDLVSKCINFLTARRSNGMFGSTQATILTLKALTEYATLVRSTKHSGDIQIYVNQKLAESLSYPKETKDKLVMTEFTKFFTPSGDQKLKIEFSNTPESLPYSVNVNWYTKHPASSNNCKVKLGTELSARSVKLNETVRLTATVTNTSPNGLPMTMAIIGIPAGLSAQPWQLKELQEKQTFDFYEINDGYVFVYYRQLNGNEVKQVKLDLKAEIPGKFTGAASSAYLYYTAEDKSWVIGNTIEIRNNE
jgi:alpha-2-macroglobulin-like protein